MMKSFSGEFVGTFILVFFGCGSVGACVFFDAFNLFEVALIWGAAVSLGIFASRAWSSAHLNPAVSLAMLLSKDLKAKELPSYLTGQFAGAFAAAGVLFLLFHPALTNYESVEGILRGTPESMETAKMYGEFFPNSGFADKISMSTLDGFFAEALGTMLLVIMIYFLTSTLDTKGAAVPLFIGLTVSVIICMVAPFTQAGLNPARDLAPRLFASLAGWGDAAFPPASFSWLTVYVLGPFAGAVVGFGLFKISKRISAEEA